MQILAKFKTTLLTELVVQSQQTLSRLLFSKSTKLKLPKVHVISMLNPVEP